MATYDQLKGMYSKMGLGSGLLNQFCSSMSAGLIYSLITMPLETAKNRMAFQTADAAGKLPYTSTVQTVTRVAATDGVLSLWNGFLPYCALPRGPYCARKARTRWIRVPYALRSTRAAWLPLRWAVRRAHGGHVRVRRSDPHLL